MKSGKLTSGDDGMDVKLFVCCHKESKVPAHELLVPMQVGTKNANHRFPGFIYDDVGENMSEKNPSYCELTAHYWAWKNVLADYYGFFHYRRYLYPNVEAKLPYHIMGKPTLSLLKRLGYDQFVQVISQYDIIAPKGCNMHCSVRRHYASSDYHHGRDLELIERIVQEYYPQMTKSMDQYLSDTICYFGNIFIMSRTAFFNYCTWLFPILDTFDRNAKTGEYVGQEARVDGYLAERLFGIYLTFYRKELKTMELPWILFEPDLFKRTQMQIKNTLLPPNSYQRAYVKNIIQKGKSAVRSVEF